MLGAIIGDIAGSRFEFNPTNDYNFELFTKDCGFTDDTICTIAVADALIKGKDFGQSIHEWCRKYPHPMGAYGGRFSQWVHSDNPQPYGSFGNGAAMRVSPVAYWYETMDEVLDAAAATAQPTHNHDEGIKGAQTVAMAIFRAFQINHTYQEAPLHIDEILKECVEFSGYDINMPKSAVINKFDETCQGTVPVALKIISMATSYEDAIRLAVSLGADADTLGAIVGSIAEAIWGLPSGFRHEIEPFIDGDIYEVTKLFSMQRPWYEKLLTDTTFYQKDYSEGAWDMLEDDERRNLMTIAEKEKDKKRQLMAERGKARYNW